MRLTVSFVALSDEETRVEVVQEGVSTEPSWDTYRTGLDGSWEKNLEGLRRWLEEAGALPGRNDLKICAMRLWMTEPWFQASQPSARRPSRMVSR